MCGFKLDSPDGISWKRVQAKDIKGSVVGPKKDKTYGTKEGMNILMPFHIYNKF